MKSTPAMRARIRELMGKEQDDYDRAVECVLDDIEALEAALREIAQALNRFNDGKRDTPYGQGILKGLTVAANIAHAALAPQAMDLAR